MIIAIIGVIVVLIVIAAIYAHKHNKKMFLLKISKYKIGDTIKFGDLVHDVDALGHPIQKITNIKEGTLNKWSETHFIATVSGKEYCRTWDNFQTNVSYYQRIAEQEEIIIKSKCSDYMAKNSK